MKVYGKETEKIILTGIEEQEAKDIDVFVCIKGKKINMMMSLISLKHLNT